MEGRILQDVERALAQRLEGALRDDPSKHVIRVSEVGGEETGERSKPFVHRLAHVPKCNHGSFRKSSRTRVHQYALQSVLNRHSSLNSSLADECGDRHVLERSRLQVHLDVLELFVCCLGDRVHVCAEFGARLRQKYFRAL